METQPPSAPQGGARPKVPTEGPSAAQEGAPPKFQTQRPRRTTRQQPASVLPAAHTAQEKIQHLQAKELLQTLSSAMEKPYWDTCQKAGTDPCIMPNIGRTPDITVIIVPDNYTQNVTYPIFIGEILGRKEQSTLTQRYAGYNATMQSLVFAPRAYYWEIRTTSPNLYILNRDPAHGRINANMKTYHLRRIEELKEMLDDLCYLFLDELIYLRPLTYISSQCLRDKDYKDFLSKPPGLDAHIENQCWHLFVPKYNCQGINAVPENFIDGIDHEDPEKKFTSEIRSDHWPRVKNVVDENLVLEVDHWNIAEGTFGDISFCHAYRDNTGKPKNLDRANLMEHIRDNAKNLAKQTAFSDIAEVLTTVATADILTPRFKRTVALSRTVELDPEQPVDPNAPPTEDWELMYYSDQVKLSCV